MTIKVGVNGFGRIGRMALRAAITHFHNIEIVAINGLPDPEYSAYMLRHDSVHGRFDADIETSDDCLMVNGKVIRLTAERDPANLKWSEVGADLIIECTGLFLTKESCQAHLDAGAKRVVQSAPPKDDTPMFVYGVNSKQYNSEQIVSAASCTTNALAPIAKVLDDSFGIVRGLMTTVHSATAKQNIVDGSSVKDWRIGRSVFENIIPSSTGAAKAVGKVLPVLDGKLTGMALRIPTADVSVIDLTVQLQQEASCESIYQAMKTASRGELSAILACTDQQLVAADFRGHPASSVFDKAATIALDDTFFKVVAWYDNEYGYTCNMLRLAELVGKQ